MENTECCYSGMGRVGEWYLPVRDTKKRLKGNRNLLNQREKRQTIYIKRKENSFDITERVIYAVNGLTIENNLKTMELYGKSVLYWEKVIFSEKPGNEEFEGREIKICGYKEKQNLVSKILMRIKATSIPEREKEKIKNGMEAKLKEIPYKTSFNFLDDLRHEN